MEFSGRSQGKSQFTDRKQIRMLPQATQDKLALGVEKREEEMWAWGQPASGQHLTPWHRMTDHGREEDTSHAP